MNRKPIFDGFRRIIGRPFTQAEVDAIDDAIDAATGSLPAALAPTPVPPPPALPATRAWKLGEAGARLIKQWEGCERRRADGSFDAYPDPGSVDGRPWTIGWGSTGSDVMEGVKWTEAQCNARFDLDMVQYVKAVARAIGDAQTTQHQFDALVSFHYNTGAIHSASLTKLHKAGKFAEARAQFGKWIFNDGRPMAGLRNRRAAEAALYART